MKRLLCFVAVLTVLLSVTACRNKVEIEQIPISGKQQTQEQKEEKKLKIIVNEKEFTVTLEDNETVNTFLKSLPVSLLMNEHNGNEKYHYLDYALPDDEKSVVMIKKGDIMLYGDRCIVVFYKSFATAYKYTRIGHVDNPDELEEAVGGGNITVDFTY